MADSNITKKALAAALTELMNEMPFSKINVSDICNKCDMNRKSFYYHFKDKYDLVNWIFDIGFISAFTVTPQREWYVWDFCERLFNYLYENRVFYRKALCITGQNAFSEHFRETLYTVLVNNVRDIINIKELPAFQIDFFVDAFVCSVERWINDKNCMPPDEYMRNLKYCFVLCRKVDDNINNENSEP